MAEPDLAEAIRNLVAQKDEHRELVRQIAADPGMSPQLRESLLAHIYEEETEKVQELNAMAGGAAVGSPSASATSSSPQSGLTVGSLRAEQAYPAGTSVGNLRGL